MHALSGGSQPGALPDFCSARVVFVVVLSAELLALVLALAGRPDAQGFWPALGLLSLLVQWVALCCSILLCGLRGRLARLGDATAAMVAWVVVTGVTAILSLGWMALPGQLRPAVAAAGGPDFVLRSVAVAGILAAVVLRYFYLETQRSRRSRAEAEARLQALQARIRPHFLFNALNTVASLAQTRPAVAERMALDLADLMRASIAPAQTAGPLRVELALVRGYLRMEALRLGERLRWSVECAPELVEAPFPGMLLQPLVENAVYHGIEPLPEGGEVRVIVSSAGHRLLLTVENPVGPSLIEERSGLGMAVSELRERLRLHYEGRAELSAQAARDRFRVCIGVPLS